MSNQVYSNDTEKYYAKKKISGFYLNVDQDIVADNTPELILWTNQSGDLVSPSFTVNAGVLTCNEAGIYSFNASVSMENKTTIANSISTDVSIQVITKQFPTPGTLISRSVVTNGAPPTNRRATVHTLSGCLYMEKGDDITVYAESNEVTVNDKGTIVGDPSGLETFIHITKIF